MGDAEKPAVLVDPLEDHLGYQLRRAAFATIGALAESFSELGLNSTEAIVIRFVQANPGCTQADISRSLGMKRTNLVPIVNGLMTRELLERTAVDGRSHSLYLTAEGARLHRRIAKCALEHEQYFFGDLDPQTRELLMHTFRALRRKGAT